MNFWLFTGCLWNFNSDTCNDRILVNESDLELLFEEVKSVQWDIIGLNKDQKIGKEFLELKMAKKFPQRKKITNVK